MGNSNQRKAATLGMPHGTANGRLRKMILFDLLKKHNENVCVRCNKLILSIEELSIEHIEPWEGVSADLFWDLKNIAFSHLLCNTPHERSGGGEAQRKIGPIGTSWCRLHQQFLPIELFSKDAKEWNGVRKVCKEHQHYYRESVPVSSNGEGPTLIK